jgi:hypothetical protein
MAETLARTYNFLRWSVIALLGVLMVSVIWQTVGSGCLLVSVSAYYHTPVRIVFVGSLFALGAALIAYQGRTPREDTLLNFSGLMAFLVALVPTLEKKRCGAQDVGSHFPWISLADEHVVPKSGDEDIASAVANNYWALMIVTSIVLVAVLCSRLRSNQKLGLHLLVGRIDNRKERIWTAWITVVCGVVLVGECALFLRWREQFIAWTHGIASLAMVLGVIGVMVLNLRRVRVKDTGRSGFYRAWYRVLILVLFPGLLIVAGLVWVAVGWDFLIFYLEIVVLLDFIAYWVVQTRELREPAAPERGEEPVQVPA